MTINESKLFGKYLKNVPSNENSLFVAADPSSIPPEIKKKLLDFDESYFDTGGFHPIANYEELKI